MTIVARLSGTETLGDRVIKVDHAGEHGAVCIYQAQRWFARWRAPHMLPELDHFIAHERAHRRRFGEELSRRGRRRCRSYFWCGAGGFVLGVVTGIAGARAITATTVAVERVVLRHMREQIEALAETDDDAVRILQDIIVEEQEHYDRSAAYRMPNGITRGIVQPAVSFATEAVIALGMRLRHG